MPPKKNSKANSNPLEGKTIVFTGALQQPRAAAKKEAESVGAIVVGSVSGKTDILIAGPGAGQKIAAAQAKGVEIWTEEQFLAAVCGSVAESKEDSKPAPKKGSKKSATENFAPPAVASPKISSDKAKSKRKSADVVDVDAKDQIIDSNSEPLPATKKSKKAAAAPAAAGTRGRRPDPNIRGSSAYSVVADYDVKLVLSNIQGPIGNNKVGVNNFIS